MKSLEKLVPPQDGVNGSTSIAFSEKFQEKESRIKSTFQIKVLVFGKIQSVIWKLGGTQFLKVLLPRVIRDDPTSKWTIL